LEKQARLFNKSFLTRTVSAILYGGAWIGLSYLGGNFFSVFITSIVFLMAVEYVSLMLAREIDAGRWIMPLCAVVYPIIIWGQPLIASHGMGSPGVTERLFALGAGTVLVFFSRSIIRMPEKNGFEEVTVGIAGTAYIGIAMSHVLLLRSCPGGCDLVWALLGILWMTDSLAYIVGIAIGRHRLAPLLSPKKSIEGAVAGVVGGILGIFLVRYLTLTVTGTGSESLLVSAPYWKLAVLGAGISIVGQVGDLAESMIKRWAGVKDSGHLIPGHGGLLDRMDSLLFAGPVMYYGIRLLEGVS